MSVHDPEMRHGHKSSSKRFDGHKASVAVGHRLTGDHGCGTCSPANASDNVGALELVERSEEGTVSAVLRRPLGTRPTAMVVRVMSFADAGRTLIAKLPRRPDSKRFPKGGTSR